MYAGSGLMDSHHLHLGWLGNSATSSTLASLLLFRLMHWTVHNHKLILVGTDCHHDGNKGRECSNIVMATRKTAKAAGSKEAYTREVLSVGTASGWNLCLMVVTLRFHILADHKSFAFSALTSNRSSLASCSASWSGVSMSNEYVISFRNSFCRCCGRLAMRSFLSIKASLSSKLSFRPAKGTSTFRNTLSAPTAKYADSV